MASHTGPSACYQSLDSTQQQIRLLSLNSASNPFAFTLQTFSLDKIPSYAALSYRWGDVPNAATITLNSHPLPIHQNLSYAVQALAHHSAKHALPQYIWIDALCINQSDIPERNQQVSLMRRIYSCATSVHVFLGPNHDAGIASLRQLASLNKYSITEGMLNSAIAQPRSGLRDFVFADHWSRVWIIQEFFLAAQIYVFSSCEFVAWDEIDLVASMVADERRFEGEQSFYAPTGMFSDAAPRCKTVIVERRHYKNYGADQSGNEWGSAMLSLSGLMFDHAAAKCSDSRDRVYGLLGLVDPALGLSLAPDYTLTTAQLYEQVMKLVDADPKVSAARGLWGSMLREAFQLSER